MKAVFCPRGAAGWECFWSGVSKPPVAGWWRGRAWSCPFHQCCSRAAALTRGMGSMEGRVHAYPSYCPAPSSRVPCTGKCPSAHTHQVVSSQGQRASALLGWPVLSTIMYLPPSTYPSICSFKKLNSLRPEIELLVASETIFFLVCQNCLSPQNPPQWILGWCSRI